MVTDSSPRIMDSCASNPNDQAACMSRYVLLCFSLVAARSTDDPQTNACRHCGSRNTHWFTPPEALDEGAILLCARCGRVTTILVADGRIVRAWPRRPAGSAA